MAVLLSTHGREFSLSLRERAGVRGNGPNGQPEALTKRRWGWGEGASRLMAGGQVKRNKGLPKSLRINARFPSTVPARAPFLCLHSFALFSHPRFMARAEDAYPVGLG